MTGATVHFVSSEVDGGPIILQEACNIDDLDNAEDIQARVLEIEHRILPKSSCFIFVMVKLLLKMKGLR